MVGEPLPGLLAELCGAEVTEYDAIGRSANLYLKEPKQTNIPGGDNRHTWCDILASIPFHRGPWHDMTAIITLAKLPS